MAVLEATGDTAYPNKVVIAGIDAIGRARALFQPRHYPVISGMATLSPHIVYAVRGTVYFMDGYGTVFRMGVDGKQTVVTRFPIRLGEQWASFAVSPDGCQLAGSILTPPAGDGRWTLQTMRATFGSPAEVLHSWTSGSSPDSQIPSAFKNVVIVGWDAVGPLAVIGSSLQRLMSSPISATQPLPLAYVSNPDFFGGTVVHLAGDGVAGAPASQHSCNPVQVSSGGDISCYRPGDGHTWMVSVVRSADGAELASMSLPVITACSSGSNLCHTPGVRVAIGPKGLVAATWETVAPIGGLNTLTTSGLWRTPTASGTLPNFFFAKGWVDAQTIFGLHSYPPEGEAFMHLRGAEGTIEELHFTGDFVGMLES